MKKYLKIFCLSLLFLCLSIKVEAKEVDFCKTGQAYYFDCEKMAMQCNYDLNGEKAYVNISKENRAMAGIGDSEASELVNWGNNDNDYGDAKTEYEKNKTCPERLVKQEKDGKIYIYLSTKANVNKKSGEDINIYIYTSSTTSPSLSTEVEQQPSIDPDEIYSDGKHYGCTQFKTEASCNIGRDLNNEKFGCAWNEQYEFCSPTGLSYLSCGSKDSIAYDIPVMVPRLTSYAITALKTITPVILIIIGMFQLIKAISSQNEDEMKKARSALIKKLIAAAMIFFLVAIVQFIVKQVADKSEQSSTEACFDCFINNNCSNAMYYTDGYGKCYAVSNNSQIDCPVDKY